MSDNKQKTKIHPKQQNVLESLKDIGQTAAQTIKHDLVDQIPADVMGQLFGVRPGSFSGEISPGEAVEFKDVMTGQFEKNKKVQKQIAFERRMLQEEKAQIDKKTNELRLQLRAVMQEVYVLSKSTTDLGDEIELAAMQAPVEPGLYHVIFFEKLLEFIKSFRKKIDEAGIWLEAVNKRAQKKNYWSSYKKHGSKFLLSGEHYLQRSAG